MSNGIIESSTSRSRQRGMASIIAVVLLIAGVLFILGQSMGIVGTRSADTTQQLDSTAALELAESGLERAQAIVGTAASSGTLSAADCTGISANSPFGLGRGNFTYGTAAFPTPIADPPGCNSAGGTPCDSCTVKVTGTVNSASRSLNQIYNFTQAYGTTGRGFTVTMVLKNIHPVPALGMFHLAWQRQDPGGNATGGVANATICPTCVNHWTVESSSGAPSVGALGVTVPIQPLIYSQPVTQYLSKSRNFVEVGALFPATTGSATPPAIVGSYWDDKNGPGGPGSRTVSNNNNDVGEVNSGVVAAGTCSATPTANTEQTCNSWCFGGDTLVYGFAGRSATYADGVSAVTFDTGSGRQNIPMNKVVHFPDQGGGTLNATGTIYSEIWWAYNAPYMSSSTGAQATSYPRAVKGSVGAIFDASFQKSDRTRMTVTNFASGTLNVGDRLPVGDSNTSSTVKVIGVPTPGPTGQYTFDGDVYIGNPNTYSLNSINVPSDKLIVGPAGVTSPLTTGATNEGVTIQSGPDGSGNYALSASTTRATQIYTQGTSGDIITVPPDATVPAVGTLVAVHSVSSGGTGAFASGTTVTGIVTANSFRVSTAPSALKGANVCGGTCAFFNLPSSTSSMTTFRAVISGGTDQWGSGFVCLKGVDPSLIAPVTSMTVKPGRWQEEVQ